MTRRTRSNSSLGAVDAASLFASKSHYDPWATDASRAARHRAAVARFPAAGLCALFIGNSWTEGIGAGTFATRYVQVVQDALRACYPSGVTGGIGYVPASYATSPGSVPIAVTYGGSTFPDAAHGLGCRARNLQAGGTITVVGTFSDLDIFYTKQINTGASFSYTVDGGSAVVVTVGTNPTAINSLKASITGLSTASHTVVITSVGANQYIEGFFAYNGDKTLGVKVIDAGHTGFTAAQYVAQPLALAQSAAAVAPDIIFIELGINDYGSATGKTTSAAFQANLMSMLSLLRAAFTTTTMPTFVLCVPPKPDVVTSLSPWSEFPAAVRAVAEADGNVGLFFADKVIGDFDVAFNYYGYRFDAYHVNTAGHRAYGQGVVDLLTKTL